MDKQEIIDTLSVLKLNQREASELLGVNIRTVRRWINGDVKIRGSSIAALRAYRVLIMLGETMDSIENIMYHFSHR